jgi:hypothetical protein
MAKLTAQNLQDDGWNLAQFGAGFANDAAFGAWLTAIADEAGRWAEAKVGAGPYGAAIGYVEDCLRRAELYYAQAHLWRRRAVHFDAQGQAGLETSASGERRGYLGHANSAATLATDALAEAMIALGLDPTGLQEIGAMSVGHIETGRYPPHSAEAING